MINNKNLLLIALGGFVALSEATRNKKPKNFIMVSLISPYNWNLSTGNRSWCLMF